MTSIVMHPTSLSEPFPILKTKVPKQAKKIQVAKLGFEARSHSNSAQNLTHSQEPRTGPNMPC